MPTCPCGGRRQIVLAHMDAVGAGEPGNIGAIVDDGQSPAIVRDLDDRRCGIEEPAAGHGLRPELQKARATGDERPSQIDRPPTRAGGRVDVNDRAERIHKRPRDQEFFILKKEKSLDLLTSCSREPPDLLISCSLHGFGEAS